MTSFATLPLLAAGGWEDFLRLLPVVIAVLAWVISQFSGKVAQQAPKGRAASKPVAPPPAKPVAGKPGDPLQAEIDQFLKQAEALRNDQRKPQRDRVTQIGSPDRTIPKLTPRGDDSRQRPARRPPVVFPKRTLKRDEPRPIVRTPSPPAAPATEAPAQRESVEQHVAQRMDSSKFAERAAQLSQVQRQSDSEFQQHMQRVFQHDMVSLKPGPQGIFEAAAAGAAAVSAAAAAAATTAAAGAETATAPNATRKAASDIAVFLAGRKNIRDAVILTEILQRPEGRW